MAFSSPSVTPLPQGPGGLPLSAEMTGFSSPSGRNCWQSQSQRASCSWDEARQRRFFHRAWEAKLIPHPEMAFAPLPLPGVPSPTGSLTCPASPHSLAESGSTVFAFSLPFGERAGADFSQHDLGVLPFWEVTLCCTRNKVVWIASYYMFSLGF